MRTIRLRPDCITVGTLAKLYFAFPGCALGQAIYNHLQPRGATEPECHMKVTANAGRERFGSGAHNYVAYLETPEGRLRTDLAFANLQEFLPLPQPARSLCALDLGCGTGAIAVRLARLGVHVTLLDSSSTMLDIANHAARGAGVAAKVVLKHGDAAQVSNLFCPGSFDVILCHNLLEYVDDPGAVVRAAAQMMRDSSAILSVLVRNQAGEVLKAAIQTGDLAAAEDNLTAGWGHESLFGDKVRLFNANSLQAMLKVASLTVTAGRGVRVISDYLPSRVSRSEEYERILELERKLGSRAEFAAVARYTHYLAHRTGLVSEDRL
jgi:S-adenosylmethionine-dependent methyltransferase